MGWLKDKGLAVVTASLLTWAIPPQLRPVVEMVTGITIQSKAQQSPAPIPQPTPPSDVQILDEQAGYSDRHREPSYITALHTEIESLKEHITEECK